LLGAAVDKDRAELERARRNTVSAAFTCEYDERFHERYQASLAKLRSTKPEVRYAARVQLAQELKQRIASITLRPDGVAVVRITRKNNSSVGFEVDFTEDRIVGMRSFAGNEVLLKIRPEAVARMSVKAAIEQFRAAIPRSNRLWAAT
jgi:hypothetical protein